MTKEEQIKIAESLGWKKWAKLGTSQVWEFNGNFFNDLELEEFLKKNNKMDDFDLTATQDWELEGCED